MDKIKAVIFDMDGVLIDAKEWHYEALKYLDMTIWLHLMVCRQRKNSK